MTYQHDVLIIGSGAAGLSLALQLGEYASVAVLSKSQLTEGATFYAQGGIAAVLDSYDSIDSHIQDTLYAGAGLCHKEIVRFVVEHGPESIQWLTGLGVNFTRISDTDINANFHLHQEGGHSHRRILHASDSTGHAIATTLENKARMHQNIELFEHRTAIDLITTPISSTTKKCCGVYAYNKEALSIEVFKAKIIVLATGGVGKVYLYTSNPDTCTGDGIAMAWRSGCRIANMEFIQFHPTCLYHPEAKSFLISEALRGEGAKLFLNNGEPFMHHFDDRGELAPRDIVARAIDHEIKRRGDDFVYLDISHRSKDFIMAHFPNIYQKCLHFGFDLSIQPIPVVPAAHYSCGGIVVDKHGQTDIPNMYAIGEVASSGLHGANRIASNSLLECIVFAHSSFLHIKNRLREEKMPEALPEWDESKVIESNEEVLVSHDWDEIRRCMWDYAGVVRATKYLCRAQNRINVLSKEIAEHYSNFRITSDLIELRNLATIAELIIRCALKRKESRGLHYSLDYPKLDDTHPPQDTIIYNKNIIKKQ